MLDTSLKTQLQAYLTRLKQPVRLVAHLDDGDASQRMRGLLQEVVALSPLLSLEERRDPGERTPSFSIAPAGEPARVRFAGVPLGHEFTSLVLALLQSGGHPPKVDDELLAQARAIEADLVFETYVSLSCQNCPDVVQALNLLAVVNPRVRHVMVDGALFREEVESKGIMAVPTVVLNGEVFGQGRMSLEEILAKLDAGAADRAAARLADKGVFDVLVVGGGPAGAAAAIYAARKGIRTGVVAERFGGQVLDTLAIENFVSVSHTEGPRLAAALEQHVRQYEVDVMTRQRATALVPGELLQVELESGARLQARSVIVSTGARWRTLGVPGEAQYRNRGVAYCPHCDGPLFRGRRVAVVGGGNSGVEAAIDLAGIAEHVTLLEFGSRLRADAVLQRALERLSNVTVVTDAQTTAVLGDGERVTGLRYTDRRSGDSREVPLAGVFVQIGLLPNTDWLAGTLRLTPGGEIEVDAHGRTSVPGVFAAGDATTSPYKQIVIAMGDGATAALGAFDHLIRAAEPRAEPHRLAA
jgi:alkyl hydroperoxide reductase subunit F